MKFVKVKWLKNGISYGYGYNQNDTGIIAEEKVKPLADAGAVEVLGEPYELQPETTKVVTPENENTTASDAEMIAKIASLTAKKAGKK